MPDHPEQKDFFVSYNKADRAWAEWIAWQLEEAGFTVLIQAWDFRPGGNFALDMQRAASTCARTVAVLSPDFLQADYTQPEWAVAFVQDPTGANGTLLPVRVRECKPTGLLAPIVYVDLVNANETTARTLLLDGVNRDRAKPATSPAFPGTASLPAPDHKRAEKPAFPGAFPPVWHIPRAANPHFTGRDELLADIRQTLQRGQAAALTALHGLGGVGKTQLAAEYAYDQRATYEAVWWVNAETSVTLANDLAGLAGALALPEAEAREIPVIVAAALRWLNGHTGWLLIYDNAPDAAAVRPYLPQARSGHVLLTSRDPNWRGLAQPLEVATLNAEAGAQFLLERTAQPDAAAARELAVELGGLPLALEQAGAFCEATQTPLGDYLRLFRQRGQELLRRNPPTDYPATVATTWEISFEAAQRECPAAAALLNLLAFCASEPLPLAVLRENAKELPEELATTVADELALADAIGALRRYSLLAREDDNVTLHRLVLAVARARLTNDKQRRWAEAALRVVNEAYPNKASDVRTWEICARLLPHARAVSTFASTWQLAPEAMSRLANQMGAYFLGRAQYAEAKQAFEHAWHLAEAILGHDHPEVAIHINNLGNVLRELGDLTGARQCFEHALELKKLQLGSDHPDVAMIVNNLGLVLVDLGDLEGARQCAERALHLAEVTFGPNHPNVAVRVNNMGLVLKASGDLSGARQCYERAVHLTETAFGPDHPNVAKLLYNLGVVLFDCGDLEGVRQCFERALRIGTAQLGEDHPFTVKLRKNLATLG
jgi:tetratricopeptide (TPR) repeat protein